MVVALVPRYAGGLEVFGVFSFHEATGRQMALPLFFLATGFLIRRFAERKSLWPVFGIIGLCVFLHPVTVLLFAFISLIALLVARLVSRERVARVIGELLLCGGAFVLGGAYLFVKVFTRLAGSASGAVANAAYVHAVLFRDIWNFPAGVLQWYPHMAVVSAAFVAALGAFYFLPQGRALGARYPLPQAKLVLAWGLAIAVGSLAAAVVIPGVNLYAMEHWGAPYLFQQWSRVAKFYYLGLFVALVPAAYALARAYEASTYRWKRALLALAFVIGVASSSLGLEVTEFAVGYPNFEPSYIPQALSHVPDGVTSQDYGSVCDALRSLGAKPGDLILSGDFAFRFYCHAHLYATTEEGDAYIQLGRADTIAWYDRLMAERSALGGGDVTAAESFAKRVGASFIIVPHTTAYAAFSAAAATSTKQYIIVKVN